MANAKVLLTISDEGDDFQLAFGRDKDGLVGFIGGQDGVPMYVYIFQPGQLEELAGAIQQVLHGEAEHGGR